MTQPKPHKLCIGCKASVRLDNCSPKNYRDYPMYECRFTPDGTKRIPRCPCTYCLVKVTCHILCDILQAKCTEYSNYDKYDSPKRGEAK